MLKGSNKKIEAIIFGFDGVLFNTDIYHFLSWKKALQRIDINIELNSLVELNGLSREKTFSYIIKKFKIENLTESKREEVLVAKDRIYKRLTNELNKLDTNPGIIKLLMHLKSIGIKTALSTTSRNSYNIMKRTHLDEYFDFIPNEEHLEKFPELNIDHYVEISKVLQIPQFKMIAIESSQYGINSANEMFIRSIGIDPTKKLDRCLLNVSGTSELTTELIDKLIEDDSILAE